MEENHGQNLNRNQNIQYNFYGGKQNKLWNTILKLTQLKR